MTDNSQFYTDTFMLDHDEFQKTVKIIDDIATGEVMGLSDEGETVHAYALVVVSDGEQQRYAMGGDEMTKLLRGLCNSLVEGDEERMKLLWDIWNVGYSLVKNSSPERLPEMMESLHKLFPDITKGQ